MAAWPTLAQVKRALDVSGDDFDTELEAARAAAIAYVKIDVGDWDDLADIPDESLSRAAHLLATRIVRAPGEALRLLAIDREYQLLLKGHRRRLPIA